MNGQTGIKRTEPRVSDHPVEYVDELSVRNLPLDQVHYLRAEALLDLLRVIKTYWLEFVPSDAKGIVVEVELVFAAADILYNFLGTLLEDEIRRRKIRVKVGLGDFEGRDQFVDFQVLEIVHTTDGIPPAPAILRRRRRCGYTDGLRGHNEHPQFRMSGLSTQSPKLMFLYRKLP